jgi:integrase
VVRVSEPGLRKWMQKGLELSALWPLSGTDMKERGFGRIYQRKWTKCLWIQYSYRGKLYRESCGSENHAVAVKLLRKRQAEMGAGKVVGLSVEKTTFDHLVALITDDYRVNQRRSFWRVELSLKHLRGTFGHDRAVDIGTGRISRYIRERQEAGAAPATVVQEIACLRRMLNLAIRAGKLATRPYVPTIRVQNVRTGFFEADEFQAVHERLPDYLQPPLEFMYLTGWRSKSEVLPLRWLQVDFEQGVVRLEPGTTKNSEGREFPFSALPQLEALLRRQRELTTALEREQGRVIPWVFHNQGEPIKHFAKAWKRATKAAGLPGRIPHDFRRTAVRNLVRAGVPEMIAMKLTGHKTRAVFDRYDITSGRDLREAVGKLARFHKNADTASGRPSSELASKPPFVPGRGVGLLGINRRVLKMNDLPDSISLCHDE